MSKRVGMEVSIAVAEAVKLANADVIAAKNEKALRAAYEQVEKEEIKP